MGSSIWAAHVGLVNLLNNNLRKLAFWTAECYAPLSNTKQTIKTCEAVRVDWSLSLLTVFLSIFLSHGRCNIWCSMYHGYIETAPAILQAHIMVIESHWSAFLITSSCMKNCLPADNVPLNWYKGHQTQRGLNWVYYRNAIQRHSCLHNLQAMNHSHTHEIMMMSWHGHSALNLPLLLACGSRMLGPVSI